MMLLTVHTVQPKSSPVHCACFMAGSERKQILRAILVLLILYKQLKNVARLLKGRFEHAIT